MARKIFRSLEDRKIAGICGGLGEYFDIDSTIIRLLWVTMIFAVGTGALAYILAWIIIPDTPIEKLHATKPVTGNS